MKKLILGAIAVSALAAPIASQAHGIPVETPNGTYYVNEENPGLWKETNGQPGLQEEAHTHGDETIPADTQIDGPEDL